MGLLEALGIFGTSSKKKDRRVSKSRIYRDHGVVSRRSRVERKADPARCRARFSVRVCANVGVAAAIGGVFTPRPARPENEAVLRGEIHHPIVRISSASQAHPVVA